MTATSEILPWHRQHWQRSIERLRAGRLPHALLVTGPVGIGKSALADQLARAVLCRAPLDDGRACGQCQACSLYQAGSHPDAMWVGPEDGSKVLKVEQIRAVSSRMSTTSQLGGHRVAVLIPAERMNAAAANGLLKTLEEPGADILLLLVSAQPGLLPATVRSRCQRMALTVPSADEAEAWLRQRSPQADVGLLLALADGAPLAAAALEGSAGLEWRRTVVEDWLSLLDGDAEPAAIAQRWHGQDLAATLGWLMRLLVDLIRLKCAGQPPRLANPDLREHLQRQAGRVHLAELYDHLQRLQEAVRLTRTQVSAQAILEQVLIPWRLGASGR